ncbi:high light inducible protein [Desmonostoc muscorum LEGE 12446]|uniref:High light inducible protein n=1 Tax=Desmonostoc muscorum LEGE 12446 TaxID=1828758 RepID=A0A8J7A5H9_DESMC|nr:high light inducible protein [Desmonostoc muscorum]MCF2150264.1 high light inducible protein [Desmonostoc muscorum LEGE 12446]
MSANTNIASSMNNQRNAWLWGFTPQTEVWNGRLAMIGFISAVLIEVFSGQGLLHFWNIL